MHIHFAGLIEESSYTEDYTHDFLKKRPPASCLQSETFCTQLILKISEPTISFASKAVIITGASSGLGQEAAKHIARLGASKIILACRNTAKGNETKHKIENALKCSKNVLEVWEVNIESAESIKQFVDRVNKLPRLDVVINNAGLAAYNFQVVYGTERTLAVNVIGTFLLAIQLIPKLKQTAKTYGSTPHMTFVGSALYDGAKYPKNHGDDSFTYYVDKSHVKTMNQYSLSKLLLLYAIIKLSSIVDKSIVISSLDPCFCKSDLGREASASVRLVGAIFVSLFARTAEEGSRLIVKAASAGRETHGRYMRAGELQAYAPIITNAEGVKRSDHVWKSLCSKLEALQPGVMAEVSAL